MDSLLWGGLLLGVAWFWLDSLRTRDLAIQLVRQLCQQYELQLLDQTVSLQHLWLKRARGGQVRWLRSYQFEFTETGASRQVGMVVLLGRELQMLELPDYVNRTIVNSQ